MPTLRRPPPGHIGPGAELVGALLQRLSAPRPAASIGAHLLDLLGAEAGCVLALAESPTPFVLATRGAVSPGPVPVSASGADVLLLSDAQGQALRAFSLGDRPRVVVALPSSAHRSMAEDQAVQLLRSVEQEISQAVAVALRVEQLEKSEAALAAAGREKEEFTSFLLHDLRNPLTVALTNLEFLREAGQTLDGEAVAALRDTEDSVSLVVDHLGGLLDIAQLEEATMPCRRQPLSLAQDIRSALDQFEFSARRRHVRLTSDCAVPGKVLLDPDLLRRMLHNLLTTSLRVTPVGGWVQVQARREGPVVTLVVANSSPPVAEEARPSLFTKYRRLGAGGRSDTHAHGLGLYFVRLAAEAHGGSVRAEARADGSAFVVVLPDEEEPRRAAS